MNSRPEEPTPIPVQATIRAAFRVTWHHARNTLPPVAAVEIPAITIMAAATVIASLTWLKDEPLDPFASGATRTLFFYLVTTGILVIFSLVARGAAVVAVAGVVRGKPLSLTAALDPAFTRMGGLIALTVVNFAVYSLIFIPFIGWVAAPYLALRLALSYEAMMLEGGSVAGALQRSWAVSRGRLWRLVGVIALSVLVMLGPLAVLSFLGLAVTGSRTQEAVLGGIFQVAQGAVIVPVVAFLSATTTLFYLQSTENLDVQRDV